MSIEKYHDIILIDTVQKNTGSEISQELTDFTEGLTVTDIETDNIDITGGLTGNTTTVNVVLYTILATDYNLQVTYSLTGACTIRLTSAQVIDGREINIKDAGNNAGTYNITIETQSTEEIEFSTTDLIIDSDGASVTLYSDGTDWFIK